MMQTETTLDTECRFSTCCEADPRLGCDFCISHSRLIDGSVSTLTERALAVHEAAEAAWQAEEEAKRAIRYQERVADLKTRIARILGPEIQFDLLDPIPNQDPDCEARCYRLRV